MSGLIPPALLFPYVVREPSETNTNCTDPANKGLVQDIKTDVSYILYTEAAITSLVNTLLMYANVLVRPCQNPVPELLYK